MKRFPKILAAGLEKARKRPLAFLVCVGLLVAAADVALVGADRIRQTANRTRLADNVRLLHLHAASTSAADYPFPAAASSSPQMMSGWIDFPLRWFRFTLPNGDEEGGPTDLRKYLRGLPGR
jgi:hypothetical protein